MMLRKVFVVVSAAALLGLGACSGGVEPVATEPVGSAPIVKAESVPEPVRDVEPEPDPEQVPEPDYEALADAVIRGDYGNGEARRLALGDDYAEVQAIVDARMVAVAPPVSSVSSAVAVATVVPDPVVEPTTVVAGIPVSDYVSSESPESQWAWWYGEFGADNPGVPADYASIPACALEDGGTLDGYEPVCYWDASSRSNGVGTSYVLVNGDPVIAW